MRVGLALALSSFGSMGAAPIQGALLTAGFEWSRPIAFSAVSLLCFCFYLHYSMRLLESSLWRDMYLCYYPHPAF